MRIIKKLILFLLIVFILPALASLAVWQADASKPRSWRDANWSSAKILPEATRDREAVIHVMAAKTGRWKGAFAVHSWLVMKSKGANHYDRYDVVGWGRPVRLNAYAPDARWYSNQPEILKTIKGEKAERYIPLLETAIADYPAWQRGDYKIWPGPNSNSFIAHVLNDVPELQAVLPSNAVGRDFLASGEWLRVDPNYDNIQVSLGGYAGFAIGKRHGFELNFLGLVTGFGISEPSIKLPGFGTIPLSK
jgi:hypothetical protein